MKHYRDRETLAEVPAQDVANWFTEHRNVTPPANMGPAMLADTPFLAAKRASDIEYDKRFETFEESWRVDAGGWHQQVLTKVDLPVEVVREYMHRWLEHTATQAGAALKNGYPQWEIDGWHKQEAQAMAALEGSTDTPLLDALAQSRGVDRLWLAQKIVDKVATYETAYGMLGGKRQAIEAAIEDAETVDDFRLITW